MASDERGTKRTCPVTGRKFYDLNKDPVVSPYTGKSYPLSFFEAPQEKAAVKFGAKERPVEDEDDALETEADPAAEAAGAEVISLEDAEEDEDNGDEIPDVDDVEVDDELGGDDDDTFLETDDDDDDIDFDVEVDEDER